MSIDVKKFASLMSYISAVTGREFSEHDVSRIYEIVDGMVPVGGDVKLLFDAMLNNRKIDAIKEYRVFTKEGLKESKDAVESIMNRFSNTV